MVPRTWTESRPSRLAAQACGKVSRRSRSIVEQGGDHRRADDLGQGDDVRGDVGVSGDRLLHVVAVVLDDDLHLASADAARGVGLVGPHLLGLHERPPSVA
ncbi:hypothetical protein STENM327S_02932 [Streptomyces tendae]